MKTLVLLVVVSVQGLFVFQRSKKEGGITMNEMLELMKSRRSVRNFTEEQIPKEALEQILEAGSYAPSGNNRQSWHFTVIQSRKVLHELNFETKEVLAKSDNPFLQRVGNNEELDIFNGAPTVILVSGNKNDANAPANCALASENILLAAHSLGIASCYIISVSYLFDGAEGEYFLNKMGVPEDYKVYNAILLGYAKEGAVPEAAPRKEDCVNYII